MKQVALTALEQEIVAEGARAIRSVPKGEVAGSTPLELRDSLARVLQSPAFARFRELVDRHSAARADERSFDIRSVSLGIEAAFAFVVGAQGSFGVAVPPGNWTDYEEYVLYLTGSVELGFVEGAIGGIVLGLYNVQPTDMDGGSYAFSVEAGLVEEVEVEASFQHIDGTGFLGLAITEAVGEDEGIDGLYSYTWVWGWDAPLAFQPPAANYMIVSSIKCNETGESGHDEIYFKFTPDGGTTYRYPTTGQLSMAAGETWAAGRSIYFNDHVTIELWDEDDIGDDTRGSHTYYASSFQTSVDYKANSGSYTVSAVLNPPPPPFPPAKRINGTDISYNGPSACLFAEKSYVVWAGTNSRLYVSASADGVTWPDGAQINGVDTTPATPTAIEFDEQLFVFWKGSNNGVYWSASGDGVAWPSGKSLANETTISPPVPCVFNGTLYLFWSLADSSHRIVYSVFNASTQSWSAHQQINGSDATSTAVAAAVFNNELYLFWRNDSSEQLYFTHAANNAWPAAVAISEWSQCAPAAVLDGGKLCVMFGSTNETSNVRYTVTSDGRTFAPSVISTGTTVTRLSQGLSVFNGKVSIFFTNPATQLCVTSATL